MLNIIWNCGWKHKETHKAQLELLKKVLQYGTNPFLGQPIIHKFVGKKITQSFMLYILNEDDYLRRVENLEIATIKKLQDIFINYTPDLNSIDCRGEGVLSTVADTDPSLAEKLLRAKADPLQGSYKKLSDNCTYKHNYYNTPLLNAIRAKKFDLAQLYIKYLPQHSDSRLDIEYFKEIFERIYNPPKQKCSNIEFAQRLYECSVFAKTEQHFEQFLKWLPFCK